MKAKWITGCILSLFMHVAVALPIQQVVVFGDSLSDTGNLYEFMRHQLPMSPPYHDGRFTDGPVWIEHLLEHYFSTNYKSHLANYAFGGSGVGSEDENDDEDFSDGAMLNLDAEVTSYLMAHDDHASPSSLYVVWMGANNYIALPDNLDAEVNFTLDGIHRNLKHLVEKGAKYIMVVGLPDLGRTPMAAEFDAQRELSYLANQHNAKLKELVQTLQSDYPEVQWIFYAVNDLFVDALDHPELYGFKNTTSTCYDTFDYLPQSESVLTMVSRIQVGSSPKSCETYLFFDPIHPSARAHKYIAERGVKVLDEAGLQFG